MTTQNFPARTFWSRFPAQARQSIQCPPCPKCEEDESFNILDVVSPIQTYFRNYVPAGDYYAPYTLQGARMGQASLGALEDIVKGVEGLVNKVPKDDPNYGVFKAKFDECLKKLTDINFSDLRAAAESLPAASQCLYSLYSDVKKYVDQQGAQKPQSTVTLTPSQPESSSIVPLLLAAGVGVGLVLLLT